MRRLLAGFLALTLCVVAALLWLGRPYLTELLRGRLERELTRAVGSPSRIDALAISLTPLRIEVKGMTVGSEPALAQLGRIDAQLAVLASLSEWRPVLTLKIESATVDLSHLPQSESSPAGRPAQPRTLNWPPLHFKEFDLTDAQLRFRMGNSVATLTVAHVAAHLQTALLARSLTAGVEVQGVELRRKSYRAKLDAIRFEGGADAGGLFVDSASLEGEGITASARGTLTPHRHAVSATFDPGLLGVVVDELSVVSGRAQVEGTLYGDLANPILDGRLTIQQGAIAGHVLGDLDTHVTRKGATLGFNDLRLVGTPGEVSGAVELVIWKELPIHGDLTWQNVDLEGLLRVIGQPVAFRDRLNARTSVDGALDPLDLKVTATGTLRRDAQPPKDVAQWTISGHVLPHALDAQLELTQAPQNHLAVRTVIEGDKLDGSITLAAGDLAALNDVLPAPVPALALTGRADGTAALGGSTQHPTVAGTVAMQDLSVVGVPVPRLNGDFALAAERLTTQRMTLEVANGAAELTGSLALDEQAENDWRLNLRDLSTDLVLNLVRGFTGVATPVNGGTLNGTVLCRGPWRRAQTQADLVAASLRIGHEALDHVDVKTTTALPQWTLQANAVHTASETLTVKGAGEGTNRLQITMDLTPLHLGNWRGFGRRRITGTVAAHAQIAGTPLQPEGFVELTASGLGVRGHGLGDVALRADGKGGEWKLTGHALADAVNLDATVRTSAQLPYTLGVRWGDADLSDFVGISQALHVITSGELSLGGSLRALGTASGALRITRFEATRDQYRVTAAEPIRIDTDNGRFHIGSFVLAAEGSRLRVEGEWTIAGDVGLDVHGDGDLVLLELIGPPFNSARGQFAVAAHVAHAVATGWDLSGQATVREFALDLGLPLSFTDTSGHFTLTGGRVRIDNLGGRTGGGEFSIGGSVDLNHGPAVSWSVHEVGLSLPEWLEERVSGKGQVGGTWKELMVSGDIEVLNALYDKRLELTALLPWFRERLAPAQRIGPPATVIRLDLRLHAPDGLFIDNNFAKVEMRADLRISGDVDKPVLTGTVEVLNGEATFRSRVFTITGGSVEFQDPDRINPVLNITAESRIVTTESEYTVRVVVSGTADAPRVQFSADDPSLRQNDVVSLVAFGKTTSDAQRETGGVGVGNVLGLLPTEYTGDLQQRVRNLFGVDRFEIEPAYLRETGAIEPRVSIGKDITDRVRALGATTLGVDSRNSVQIEYRVTGRISLLGSWESRTQDQAGAFGGDIKFRYVFRKVPFSLFGDSLPSGPQRDAQ